jgi:hypothetical protein
MSDAAPALPTPSLSDITNFTETAGISTQPGSAAQALPPVEEPAKIPSLPATPLEAAMTPDTPSVAKQVQDSEWLDQMPEFDPKVCAPTPAEMERFVGCLCLDRPFVVEVTVLGGKMPVVVQAMTNQQMEFLYAYLRALDVSQAEFFTELRLAAAALQIKKIGGQGYSDIAVPEKLPEFIDELRLRDRILNSGQPALITDLLSAKRMAEFRERRDQLTGSLVRRVAEFRAMQHTRWAAIITAVRMAAVKNRLLADLIVREDPVFSNPEAPV